MKPSLRAVAGLLAVLSSSAGCKDAATPPGSEPPPPGAPPAMPDPGKLDPGAKVDLGVPPARQAAIAKLEADLAAGAPANAADFAGRWRPAYPAALGYDPRKALGFDLIQASHLKLADGETAIFGARGFVISARQAFPNFFYGYKTIYADDLPVFISADSILYAVHRSYDKILLGVEQLYLVQALTELLRGMHDALATSTLGSPVVRADADLYLTVARRLLARGPNGVPQQEVEPVAGADPVLAARLVDEAVKGEGWDKVPLFGDPERAVDFSQFAPRGHYLGDYRLENYFRAMIWLGRTDLRLIEKQRFLRRQFDVALVLSLLLDDTRRASWQQMDEVLRGFVGESDNMTPVDMGRLGGGQPADLFKKTDQELAQTINEGGFGIQRIASQILVVPPLGENAPLDRTWLLFGQRYVLDSEVLSNVVFDRVLAVSEKDRRMLPDPLDVAFAALGNTHAAPFLADDLAAHVHYPEALHRARLLVERHEPQFWQGSLYHGWLGALRAMSPPADLTGPEAKTLPAVARTEAWSRRVLNTQLASWAELRHDTLLYAKQSYTGVPACEFPDAYVDPYPELWAALAAYADRGIALVEKLPVASTSRDHFAELRTVSLRLEDMARRQQTGMPFTPEQIAWVNEAVTIKEVPNCGPPVEVPDGWYVRLFYDRDDAKKIDPTIADVHTDPYDAAVLHVGTGMPRLLVMTADTCLGPRAYVGVASSYYEKLTTDFTRLDDPAWAEELKTQPPDVRWMKDLVAR